MNTKKITLQYGLEIKQLIGNSEEAQSFMAKPNFSHYTQMFIWVASHDDFIHYAFKYEQANASDDILKYLLKELNTETNKERIRQGKNNTLLPCDTETKYMTLNKSGTRFVMTEWKDTSWIAKAKKDDMTAESNRLKRNASLKLEEEIAAAQVIDNTAEQFESSVPIIEENIRLFLEKYSLAVTPEHEELPESAIVDSSKPIESTPTIHKSDLKFTSLNNYPREKLRFIIEEYGRSAIRDSNRCRELLRELAPEHLRETNLLMLVLTEGFVSELTAENLESVAQRLHNEFGTQPEFALWAVESWALALNLIQ